MLNRSYVSTEMFLKNNRNEDFDSFIFGSSRSIAFTCEEWEKYLTPDCSLFSFGAWNESFEGIYRKIQFIDSMGNRIKNVVIVVDADMTFKREYNKVNDHYLIAGLNFYEFHVIHFFEFLRRPWLVLACVDYKLFNERRSYMKDFVGMRIDDIDPINNDWFINSEDLILKDSLTYYSASLDKFYERSKTEIESEIQISTNDSLMLQKINSIFRKHKTEIKIIIGPLYDQIKFNNKDLKYLQIIFGEESIFDFSGINSMTENKFNFKNDVNHYRQRTAYQILKSVYK